MLTPSFKDKPNTIATAEHQFCGPWWQHCLRAEVQGGVRESRGGSCCKAWLQGCSYTGSVRPHACCLSGYLEESFQQQARVAKLLSFFFFPPPPKPAVVSKQFSSRILHFPPPPLHVVGVKEQGGACRAGRERCGMPAVRESLLQQL